jgi:prepilin-type N-terminal cleavage/methylation domain-containing protein
MKKINNREGFSLIELMVVVAIIGILATIAVPNFQKFQARSKQTNAKAELSSVFSAQKSFFAEYSIYSPVLPAIGFVPEGLNEATSFTPYVGSKRYYSVSSGVVAGHTGLLVYSLQLAPPSVQYQHGYPANVMFCSAQAQMANLYVGAGTYTPSVSLQGQAFTAASAGCPLNKDQATLDIWWINDLRITGNSQSGL